MEVVGIKGKGMCQICATEKAHICGQEHTICRLLPLVNCGVKMGCDETADNMVGLELARIESPPLRHFFSLRKSLPYQYF